MPSAPKREPSPTPAGGGEGSRIAGRRMDALAVLLLHTLYLGAALLLLRQFLLL